MGKTGNVLVVLSLQESREYMTYIVLTFCESNRVKLFFRFSLVTRAKFGVTKKEKTKNHARVKFCLDAPTAVGGVTSPT